MALRDHYLDLVVRTGRDVELTDIDELMVAVREGLLSQDDAERAVARSVAAVDGLASNGYDLQRWLAGQGMPVSWPVSDGLTGSPPGIV